jgi:PTS system N-acetylgalactosamine-specific IIA component
MKNSDESSGDSSSSPRAIVAGHGGFPDGIVSAVDQISGRGDAFVPLSNQGLSGEDIESRLSRVSSESGVKVFFTDLPGGSATLAVRRLMRSNPDLVLVTGANLATLLEFVFQSEADPATAAKNAAEKGRAALGAFGGA